MKRIIIILVAIAVLIFLVLKFNLFTGNPEIKYLIKEKTIDLGKIKQSDRTIATFKIENVGDSNIEIENVITDCHCTAPVWSKYPIKKGDNYDLLVEYDNHSTGFFEQTITVYFKSDKNSPPLLIIQGVITQ